MFEVVQHAGYDAVGFMLDCPPEDAADDRAYVNVVGGICRSAVRQREPRRGDLLTARVALPATRELCFAAGIVPCRGQRKRSRHSIWLARSGKAGQPGRRSNCADRGGRDCWRTRSPNTRARARSPRSACRLPRSALVAARDVPAAAAALGFPVVVKAAAAGLEHKSEVGGVILNVRTPGDAAAAAQRLAPLADTLLVEEMVSDGVAEVLVGICVDPQFGQLLVLGAGGVLTELLRDSDPAAAVHRSRHRGGARAAAHRTLLQGFRGRPPGDVPALIEVVLACTR